MVRPDKGTARACISVSIASWALSVSWLIWLAAYGRGAVVAYVLGGDVWRPLARLTFGAYLLHPLLLVAQQRAEAQHLHSFSHTWLLFRTAGMLVVSYGAALLLYLLVEVWALPASSRVSLPGGWLLQSSVCRGSVGESRLCAFVGCRHHA
jgi:hypothetical protein